MNPFASRVTKTISLPGDPEHSITVRKLSGRQLERAASAFFNTLIAGVQERGGASVQKDVEQLFARKDDKTADQIAKVKADPLNGYDKHVLCAKGIVAWTYEESLTPAKPFDMKTVLDMARQGKVEEAIDVVMKSLEQVRAGCGIQAIEDLDEDALEFIATEILRLTKPRLFETEEEAEDSRKNA